MVISKAEIHTYLSIAKSAASLAGDFLSRRIPSNIKVNLAKGKDIKIAADVDSEEIILKYLIANSKFSILSEERGFVPGENQDCVWIVDPLDGTMNYFKGIPLCCVSIGLWHKNTPLLGVVNNFNTNELCSGIVGEGAWIEDARISVSDINQKQKAVLCTGFPANADFSKDALNHFMEDVCLYKKIRMIGSAALSICYVACGKVDVYYEKDIMLWDIAGGIPIVLGAGGLADYKNAQKRYSCDVYVSNGKIKHS